METSKIFVNVTEDSIKHWESFCNDSAWSGNVSLSLRISNSLGNQSRIIQLSEMKSQEVAQPNFDYTLNVYTVFGSGLVTLFLVFLVFICRK